MLLTVREAAKELHVNVNYVYELINAGMLQSLKLGSMKIRREALEQFLKTYEGQNVDEELKRRKHELAENSNRNLESVF